MGAARSTDTIARAWEVGRSAHPELAISLEAFGAFAGARDGAEERPADLYLACGCAGMVPGAAEAFLDRFGDRMALYLGRLAADRDILDEVRQLVFVRCLVGDGERPPAIASYSGRGSLEGWVRATAMREALALERERGRHVELTASVVESDSDRELATLIGHYREPVVRAFTTATAQLPREHRVLLRLHYVFGLTTADLAQMFQVSRATLVRRITDARDALFERLQGELFAGAGVPRDDCESVLRLVKSQVDLRLSSLLRESAA